MKCLAVKETPDETEICIPEDFNKKRREKMCTRQGEVVAEKT